VKETGHEEAEKQGWEPQETGGYKGKFHGCIGMGFWRSSSIYRSKLIAVELHVSEFGECWPAL
jgi:hypothetical protein